MAEQLNLRMQPDRIARVFYRLPVSRIFHLASVGHAVMLALMGDIESGFFGEIMAYKKDEPATVGVVVNEVQGQSGRPSHLTIQLMDGTTRTGPVEDFRSAEDAERRKYHESRM